MNPFFTQATMTRHEKMNTRGEVFRVWWECDSCQTAVMSSDRYCRGCGLAFQAVKGASLAH